MTAFQNLQSTLWTLTIRNAREAARLYFEPMVSGLRFVDERRIDQADRRGRTARGDLEPLDFREGDRPRR